MTLHHTKDTLRYLLSAGVALPLLTGLVSPGPAHVAARDAPSIVERVAPPADNTLATGLPPGIMLSVEQQPAGFANPAFQQVWARTDRPVASGLEKRSWYWGPAPGSAGLQESYAEGAGGTRLVQYFDKSRMEINNPSADPNSPFYVTNGLLTVELISGKMQTGNNTYVDRWPADIPLASDPDDANAPTYRSFQGVSNTTLGDHPASPARNQAVTATIFRDGSVSSDPTKASYPDDTVAYYEVSTRHNIPAAIWDFLNMQGGVYDGITNSIRPAKLSDPWFYATGYPISEAYWARVKIAGQPQDVMIQAFERRVVTYVPNGVPGFKVQMGNIGQHYYDWRYRDAGKPAGAPTPVVLPTTAVPTVQPTATTPAAPPTNTPDSCEGIPANQNATVTPNCGPGGTRFVFGASGFQSGENVGVYITDPTQAVYGATFQANASSSGTVGGIYLDTTTGIRSGIYAITFEGTTTHRKAIGYFKLVGNSPPTPGGGGGGGSSCTDVPPQQNMDVAPSSCAARGTRFSFTGHGFQPHETVSVYVTDPTQAVYGAPFQLTTNDSGTAGAVFFSTAGNFPLGIWAMTMEGIQSHSKAIGYFKLIP